MDTVTNIMESDISAGTREQGLHAFAEGSAESRLGSLLLNKLDLIPTMELFLTMDVPITNPLTQLNKLPTTPRPHSELKKLLITSPLTELKKQALTSPIKELKKLLTTTTHPVQY